MKTILRLTVVLALGGAILSAEAASQQKSSTPTIGLETAKTLAKITGVAISPLLGVGAVGAWEYFEAPKDKKGDLSWYARPMFWLPALLLVGVVGLKDAFGTVMPPGLKKPLDVADTLENKITGLVAAGAFVPLVTSIFPGGSAQAFLGHGLSVAGLATIDFATILNLLLVPLTLAAFVLVWLVGHAINVLILLSPFGAVDAGLKAFRLFLMSLVTATSFANPYAGAVLSVIVIVLAYFVAGWSFRLTVCGSIYVWDWISGRRKRFTPAANANWMFTARKIEKTPIRTYGKLVRDDKGGLTFEYRPWLFMMQRTLTMPKGTYAVGRGLFYPEIMMLEGTDKTKTMLVLPPRYRTHEDAVARAAGITEVRDVGLLKGFKAIWRWMKGLFGFGAKAQAAAASA